MKLFKSLWLASALGVLASVTAHAQSTTYNWTPAGGAWVAANQSSFNPVDPTYEGDIYSNQGYSTQSTDAVLHVTNVSGKPPGPSPFGKSGGLYETFYYTLFSTPTFTLTTNDVLSGAQYIRLEISFGGQTTGLTGMTVDSVGFSFGGTVLDTDFNVVAAGQADGNDMFKGTWDFHVDITDDSTPLEFTWSFGNHTAMNFVAVTQSFEAIPEPSTYALVASGVLGAAFLRRRSRLAA